MNERRLVPVSELDRRFFSLTDDERDGYVVLEGDVIRAAGTYEHCSRFAPLHSITAEFDR